MSGHLYDPVIEFWASVAALMESVMKEKYNLNLASSLLINVFPFKGSDFLQRKTARLIAHLLPASFPFLMLAYPGNSITSGTGLQYFNKKSFLIFETRYLRNRVKPIIFSRGETAAVFRLWLSFFKWKAEGKAKVRWCILSLTCDIMNVHTYILPICCVMRH